MTSITTVSSMLIKPSFDTSNIIINSKVNNVDAIKILADGGTTSNIVIANQSGTGNASILMSGNVGGVLIESSNPNRNAIKIGTTGSAGHSSTVMISNDTGVNSDAITLTSNTGGITIQGKDNTKDITVNNSPLLLEQISAPTSTTDRLYNVSGNIRWNGNYLISGADYAIINYEEPHATDGSTLSNGTNVYPLNTVKYNGIGLTLHTGNNVVELSQGDYLIEGFYNIYYNFTNAYSFHTMYLELMSDNSLLSDAIGCSGYYLSQNSQTDYRMHNQVPMIGNFTLASNDKIRLGIQMSNSPSSVSLGRNNNLTVLSTDLPEIYGSFKFSKLS